MNLPNTHDDREEGLRLAYQLVSEGVVNRGERLTIEEVRRRLDAVQDGIEQMLARRADVAVPNNLK